MASSEGAAEARGAAAAVSISSTKCKVKRTPVILNIPRKPDVAHFKVLQWNVLADGLAQHGDFCRVPPGCLEWEYRRPLLLQEIMEANADIICLQELNHFDELHQVLSGLGYEGAFREKRYSPALKYEYPPDGMAVFYRSRRFCCSAEGVEGRSFQDCQTGREQSQGYLQILLQDLVVGRELLVVTTHLKAKDAAECEDMRYRQVEQLLHNVEETLQRLQRRPRANGGGDSGNGGGAVAAAGDGGSAPRSNGSETAARAGGGGGSGGGGFNGNGSSGEAGGSRGRVCVVITGDLNTMPASKTCQAFRKHPLGLKSLWEQRPLDARLSSGSDVDLPPGLVTGPRAAAAPAAEGPVEQAASSQQPSAQPQPSPPFGSEFSTWKFRVKGESKRISDYIWFSGGGLLRPLQRWRMLTEEEIGPMGLPSSSYASDHVSLCCEFEWDVEADLEWAPCNQEPDWG